MGRRRWKGELAKPIRPKVIRPRGLRVIKKTAQVANKEMEELYRRAVEEAWFTKLELLMDHYGITDKTDFPSLALSLALELRIPGFKVDQSLRLEHSDWGAVLHGQNKRGRPPKWPLKQRDLLSSVEEIKKKHGISTDHEALAILIRRREWSRRDQGQDQWRKTLKNRLAEERRLNRLAETAARNFSKLISPKRNPGN
jgi:hypothetical protein